MKRTGCKRRGNVDLRCNQLPFRTRPGGCLGENKMGTGWPIFLLIKNGAFLSTPIVPHLSSVPLLDFLDLAKNGVFPDRNLFSLKPLRSRFSTASGRRLHFRYELFKHFLTQNIDSRLETAQPMFVLYEKRMEEHSKRMQKPVEPKICSGCWQQRHFLVEIFNIILHS